MKQWLLLAGGMLVAGAAWAQMTPVPWPAVDALGRALPLAAETGPPRADRTLAMFYFLWLGPHAQAGGPWDITKILAQNPDALRQADSPLWGPLHAPHHWGESIFGYYNSDDPYVLRKHAQLLSDAGVDAVVFDVTNQATYPRQYRALLETWSQVRREGSRTPQVAFLCPFWKPKEVVRTLWRDLYAPGWQADLWFRWQGKPLLLADPDLLSAGEEFSSMQDPAKLEPGRTLAQAFTAERAFHAVAARVPTWGRTESAVTLTLRRGGVAGEAVATRRLTSLVDNGWVRLEAAASSPWPAGEYGLELSDPSGEVGWWSDPGGRGPRGQAFADGAPVSGARSLRLEWEDEEAARWREFFTFRAPQPDYFRGPLKPDMWSWLEVFPQHVFPNAQGEPEQMSVGVAQNALGGRLGSLSETGARGRTFHAGARDTGPGAIRLGLNFAEQFTRALQVDPRVLFITGWNEWIAGRHDEFAGRHDEFAGRHDEFAGIKEPVMFVDQFNQEFSRDLEPMQGGHGDDYYYQFAAFARRYKGTPPLPVAGAPVTVPITADFAPWERVTPDFRDDAGDTAHRDFPGYANHTRYVNASGRHDFTLAKAARDEGHVYFYVETREPLGPPDEPGWMWLFVDADGDPATGWEGFDLMINRHAPAGGRAVVERHAGGGWHWRKAGEAVIAWEGRQLHLALPRALCPELLTAKPWFDFKWADHVPAQGDFTAWLDAGDTAPNGRFRYRFHTTGTSPH